MNPLTALYGGATAVRNVLFDRGILPAHRLHHPVVSIGNLSVGGSGKTPFVLALGRLLQARGISFDVLSRGYGRETRGVRLVDPEGRAADFGDEPVLLARRLRVPVVVGEHRYDAGRFAEQKFPSQLHLLDDGFQHRSLARDFDIVLLTERDFGDQLLPTGRLREPFSSLRRADAVVLRAGLAVDHPALRHKAVWRTTRDLVLPPLAGSPVVFCGIAHPEQFFAQVRAAGVVPAAEMKFRDHHAYDREDVQTLIRVRRERQAGGFLTTEKDAIKLAQEFRLLDPIAVAELTVTLDNPEGAVDGMLSVLSRALTNPARRARS